MNERNCKMTVITGKTWSGLFLFGLNWFWSISFVCLNITIFKLELVVWFNLLKLSTALLFLPLCSVFNECVQGYVCFEHIGPLWGLIIFLTIDLNLIKQPQEAYSDQAAVSDTVGWRAGCSNIQVMCCPGAQRVCRAHSPALFFNSLINYSHHNLCLKQSASPWTPLRRCAWLVPFVVSTKNILQRPVKRHIVHGERSGSQEEPIIFGHSKRV